jgi:uncharacterized protein (TIGR03435 family)
VGRSLNQRTAEFSLCNTLVLLLDLAFKQSNRNSPFWRGVSSLMRLDASNRVLLMLNLRPFLLKAGRTLIGIAISVTVPSVAAQNGNTPGAKTAADKDAAVRADLAFDVVSIRPSNADPDQWHLQVAAGGDRYEAIGMPLGMTVMMAYFPYTMRSRDRIIGAPGWVWNDKYDVVGKVGEADLPAWQKLVQRGFMVQNPMLQTMLQNAMADRCKMSVHRVSTQIDGYALIVANHGPNHKNLVESKPNDATPERAIKINLGGRMVPIYSNDDPVLHFYQTSMASFVLMFSAIGGGPVEDRTGLTGKYRFDLTRLGTEGIPPSDWDIAPLGLKLIPAKIPTENIVIDHIEQPSPN